MLSIINIHNTGSSQVETDLSFEELEKAKWELMRRGYDCIITRECKKLQLIVNSQSNYKRDKNSL